MIEAYERERVEFRAARANPRAIAADQSPGKVVYRHGALRPQRIDLDQSAEIRTLYDVRLVLNVGSKSAKRP